MVSKESKQLIDTLQRLVSGNSTLADIELLQRALLGKKLLLSASREELVKNNFRSGAVIKVEGVEFKLSPSMVEQLLTTPYKVPLLSMSVDTDISAKLPVGSRMFYLPSPVFTGREDDLKILYETLVFNPEKMGATEQPVGILITGKDGIGKTQLAVEFCYRFGEYFRGVHWLNAEDDLGYEIAACGLEMGLQFLSDKIIDRVHATLEAWIRDCPHLIVIDNLRDFNTLNKLMESLPAGTPLLVITSASDIPKKINLLVHELHPLSPAVSLEMLYRLSPGLKDAFNKGLDAVINQMEGIPLALYLAGRCMDDGLTPDDYLMELDSAGIVLIRASGSEREKTQMIQRIPSLALAFAVSWKRLRKQLNPDMVWRVFQTCGYCAPSVPISWDVLENVMKVADDAGRQELFRAISVCCHSGLLTNTRDGPVIHSMIAEFARWVEKAAGEGSMMPFLVSGLENMVNQERTGESPVDIKNLRKHLEMVTAERESAGLEKTGELWHSLGHYLWTVGEFDKAHEYLEKALVTTEAAYGSEDARIASVTSSLGKVLEGQNDLPAARACHEQAIRIWTKRTGDENIGLAGAYACLGSVMKKLGDFQEARLNYEKALSMMRNVLGLEHLQISITLNKLGEVLEAQKNLDEARVCYEKASRIDEKILGGDDPNLAASLGNYGRILEKTGSLDEALVCYIRAFRINETVFGLDNPRTISRLSYLIDLLKNQGKLDDTAIKEESPYLQALRVEEVISGSEHLNTAERASSFAKYLTKQGDLNKAKEYSERALQIIEEELGIEHPRTASAINNLGEVYYRLGEFARAKNYFEQAQQINEKVYGPMHPTTGTMIGNLGKVLWVEHDLNRAKTLLLQALMIFETSFGPDYSDIALVATDLGNVLLSLKDERGARTFFERALQIDEKTYGKTHPDVARDLNNLGEVLYKTNNLAEARECFERALQINGAVYGLKHPNVPPVVNNLASVLWAQGDLPAAKKFYEHALVIDESIYGEIHLNVARDASNLGNVLKAQGDLQGARVLYQRVLKIRQRLLPPSHPKVLSVRRSLEALERKMAKSKS